MEVVNKKLVLEVIMIGIFCAFFIWQNISDKETKLEMVSLNNETKSSSMFAIMLEEIDEEGNSIYIESGDNTWPSTLIYSYDEVRSECMDTNGNKIENALTYDEENKIASVETSNTSYCYLYFEIIPNLYKLCRDYNNLNECMLNEYSTGLKEIPNITQDEIENTGGMRRYQGTASDVTNNYICFGTNYLETCTSDTEKYVYRIIGITEEGNIKILKKQEINATRYSWHTDASVSATIKWPECDLFKGINGIEGGSYSNLFVNNDTYDYMEVDSDWYNKIVDYNWKYGYVQEILNEDFSAEDAYEIEKNFIDEVNSKVGLMYVHDILFQQGWTLLSRNSTSIGSDTYEYTMSRYNSRFAVVIHPAGNLVSANPIGYSSYFVRPVFYTISEIAVTSGTGTLSNPYLIS